MKSKKKIKEAIKSKKKSLKSSNSEIEAMKQINNEKINLKIKSLASDTQHEEHDIAGIKFCSNYYFVFFNLL